jgi:hypothetical protein
MKANRAFFAGVLGGLVMTILLGVARGVGLAELNLEMTLGTVAIRPDLNAWILGLFLHILLAGVFALLYGQLFEVFRRAGPLMGVAVGLSHAVVVGVILGVLSRLHPTVGTAALPDPGFFATNLGATDVIIFFAVHVVFGMIVGTLYEKPLHAGDLSYRST